MIASRYAPQLERKSHSSFESNVKGHAKLRIAGRARRVSIALTRRHPQRLTFVLDGFSFPDIIQRRLNYFQKAATMKGITRPPTNLQTLADRLKVLAEPKRLLILHLLMEGVQCNCELGDALQMAPNLISHHLSVLRAGRPGRCRARCRRCALDLLLDQSSRAQRTE